MIVITGAAGFIGSALVAFLNEKKIFDAVLVDNFDTPVRYRNLAWKHYGQIVTREECMSFITENAKDIEAIVHLGAKSGYLHNNWEAEKRKSIELHRQLWAFCTEYQKSLIYASTGAVYGDGQIGFCDDEKTTFQLAPRHPYAKIKLEIDRWSLQQENTPPFWAGLRMSNVYGPNEYHKMSNASILYKAYNEILSYGSVRLFASDRVEFEDGGMIRDYVYIKDVVKIIFFLLEHRPESGIYNVASGQGTSFNAVVKNIFEELMMIPQIQYEPILPVLKDSFPYQVVLDIQKLRKNEYVDSLVDIQSGTQEYIEKYLSKGEFY